MITPFIKQLKRASDYIITVLGVVSLAVVFLSVIVQIFSRVFNLTALWTDEIAKICFVWAIYLGAVLVIKDEELIKLDLLANILPQKFMKILGYLFKLITLVVMGVSLPGSIRLVISNMNYRLSFTKIPYGVLYMVSILFFISVSVIMCIRVFSIQRVGRKAE